MLFCSQDKAAIFAIIARGESWEVMGMIILFIAINNRSDESSKRIRLEKKHFFCGRCDCESWRIEIGFERITKRNAGDYFSFDPMIHLAKEDRKSLEKIGIHKTSRNHYLFNKGLPDNFDTCDMQILEKERVEVVDGRWIKTIQFFWVLEKSFALKMVHRGVFFRNSPLEIF
jgi:hypothetical protein